MTSGCLELTVDRESAYESRSRSPILGCRHVDRRQVRDFRDRGVAKGATERTPVED
jgi:hypothetical protein